MTFEELLDWLVAEMQFGVGIVPPPMPVRLFEALARTWQRTEEPDPRALNEWRLVLVTAGCQIKDGDA